MCGRVSLHKSACLWLEYSGSYLANSHSGILRHDPANQAICLKIAHEHIDLRQFVVTFCNSLL